MFLETNGLWQNLFEKCTKKNLFVRAARVEVRARLWNVSKCIVLIIYSGVEGRFIFWSQILVFLENIFMNVLYGRNFFADAYNYVRSNF